MTNNLDVGAVPSAMEYLHIKMLKLTLPLLWLEILITTLIAWPLIYIYPKWAKSLHSHAKDKIYLFEQIRRS